MPLISEIDYAAPRRGTEEETCLVQTLVRAVFGTNNVDTRRARVSERMMPGVVYPTFPPAGTGADVVTAEFADWATSCPAYKVTAVDIRRANRPSEWQKASLETRRETTGIMGSADAAE